MQALLDLKDMGLGTMTIDQAFTKVSNDPRLRNALQAKWNSHAYPERSMEWAQLTKAQQLMTLSDEALKVLTFMGMYAHQSTLLQVAYKDLCCFTGVKRTRLREAIKELVDCGCVRIEQPSVRHAAPIYAVNPSIINKGARRKSSAADFAKKISGDGCSDFILTRKLPVLVQQEAIYQDVGDGNVIAFNRLTPALPSSDDAPRKRKRNTAESSPASDEQLPGQMSINDFPDLLPEVPEVSVDG